MSSPLPDAAPGSTEADSITTVVVLVNLGTTGAPTPTAIRGFLRPFLSDRRVVDVPRVLWLPLLYTFILPFRPRRLVPLYQSIWIGGQSPLTHYTRRLLEHVQRRHQECVLQGSASTHTRFLLATRYGQTDGIRSVLERAHHEYCALSTVIVLPLFPQYSSTTTASIFDEVLRFYLDPRRRRVPSLQLIRDYATQPTYITAVVTGIAKALRAYCGLDSTADAAAVGEWVAQQSKELVIVLSYHSIPCRYSIEGDDYPERCTATTRCVVAQLSHKLQCDLSHQVVQVYQSRFGTEKWLEPFFDDAMSALPVLPTIPENKAKKEQFAACLGRPECRAWSPQVCFAATPGFAVDCLETLHEIQEEGGETFKRNGGKYFHYVPCLNDSQAHVDVIHSVVNEYL